MLTCASSAIYIYIHMHLLHQSPLISISLTQMAAAALMDPKLAGDMDRLSYEIFSILESKFLFGMDVNATSGRVRVLSIDGCGGPSDGLLQAASLSLIESLLQNRSGDPSAQIADFFDVAAGAGAGGVLAAMLFTRGPDGRPLFSAVEAFDYFTRHRRRLVSPSRRGFLRGLFGGGGRLRRVFGDATLRDTVKPVLIPCYDLSTGAPFLFSRADAVETDGYDFLMREVCAATCVGAAAAPVAMRSVDGRTRIVSVGGGMAAMGNPTAAAITHVLNNKQEFPLVAGLDDLLVVSLGGRESDPGIASNAPPSPAALVRIAGDGVADMVDQAVAMAFGHNRTNSYVRIQAHGFGLKEGCTSGSARPDVRKVAGMAEEVMRQRNVESVMFRGKKLSEKNNAEKLEWFSGELIKEQERRRREFVLTVVIKQAVTPRTSSATTSTVITTTTITSTTTGTSSSP